ncbi:MAG TPA: DUF1361 domain-containing protein [Dehalococcoidia bacterium]|nr:DUF1361 domain-containing protein [Dehalococcoidia bacterium]
MRASLSHASLRVALAVAGLAGLSAACTAMLAFRIQETGSARYAFLTWNLMLAWTPVGASLVGGALLRTRRSALAVLALPVAGIWLLFLPNAPYLATDLIHLGPSPLIPLWYDAAMLAMYGGLGVLLGLMSLLLMHRSVALYTGRAGGWLFAAVTLVLTAFGVYLGRFQRLNSWEVFSSPTVVLQEVWTHLSDPLAYSRALEFTALVTLLLATAYLALHGVDLRVRSVRLGADTHAGGLGRPLCCPHETAVGGKRWPWWTPGSRRTTCSRESGSAAR